MEDIKKMQAKKYIIYLGKDESENDKKNENVIGIDNVGIEIQFEFYDYKKNSTLKDLKAFFMENFNEAYQYCKCQLSVFDKNGYEYHLISEDEKKELNNCPKDDLYLIKRKAECVCECKNYKEYINISKLEAFDEIIKLKKEIDKLKKTEEINNHINPKFENFYDIIIDINSIKNVNKEGWKVKYNENGLKKYNDYKDKELITIGVLGNANKGKSFLLSKISKIKLLSGTSIQTEGLSVKYPDLKGHEGRQIILLDSAGLETPVLKNIDNKNKNENENENENAEQNEKENKQKEEKNNKESKLNEEFKENARDKIMTELLLESLIIKFSGILLIVVGKLTYSEQLLINKIKIESKKQNKVRMIIIHNLQEFRTKEQVKNYIEETLLKCSTFDLKIKTWISTKMSKDGNKEGEKDEKIEEINEVNEINDNNIHNKVVDDQAKLNNIHFTEIVNYGNNQKLEIFHLILANEDSEAGQYYNQYAYDFIESIYNLISDHKKFDVFKEVQDTFKSFSDSFIIDKIEDKNFNEIENIIKDKKMILNSEDDLKLKKCFTDELGFSLFKTDNFEPKYNYFKPDENTIEVRLEIPGNVSVKVQHKVQGDKTIINVTGNKKRDKYPLKKEDDLFDIREFSEFEVNIPLKVEQFKIKAEKLKDGFPKFVNGICLIQYELAPEGAKEKAENISEKL